MRPPDMGAPDSVAADRAQREDERDAAIIAMLRVQLQTHGFDLLEDRGAFLVSRWGRTVHCIGLDALASFLARLRGSAR